MSEVIAKVPYERVDEFNAFYMDYNLPRMKRKVDAFLMEHPDWKPIHEMTKIKIAGRWYCFQSLSKINIAM